jgi:hypothetical protein
VQCHTAHRASQPACAFESALHCQHPTDPPCAGRTQAQNEHAIFDQQRNIPDDRLKCTGPSSQHLAQEVAAKLMCWARCCWQAASCSADAGLELRASSGSVATSAHTTIMAKCSIGYGQWRRTCILHACSKCNLPLVAGPACTHDRLFLHHFPWAPRRGGWQPR